MSVLMTLNLFPEHTSSIKDARLGGGGLRRGPRVVDRSPRRQVVTEGVTQVKKSARRKNVADKPEFAARSADAVVDVDVDVGPTNAAQSFDV